MQGQYAPLGMLNQFTNALVQTGLNNASATNRTAMQLEAQRAMEQDRLEQAGDQFTLTHALNMQRADDEEYNRNFGRLKDVETFKDTMLTTQSQRDYYKKMGDAATTDAGSKRITANVPGDTRTATTAYNAAGAKAGWDMRIKEIITMEKLLPPVGEDPEADRKRTALEAWRTQLNTWMNDPNGEHYLRAFEKTQMSNPMFGMIQGGSQPANSAGPMSDKWSRILGKKKN